MRDAVAYVRSTVRSRVLYYVLMSVVWFSFSVSSMSQISFAVILLVGLGESLTVVIACVMSLFGRLRRRIRPSLWLMGCFTVGLIATALWFFARELFVGYS